MWDVCKLRRPEKGREGRYMIEQRGKVAQGARRDRGNTRWYLRDVVRCGAM